MKEHRCASVTEWLRYLDVAKELGHETLSADDLKARTLGFADTVLDMVFSVRLAQVVEASGEERERLREKVRTPEGRAELFGSFDRILQAIFEEDPEAPVPASYYDEDGDWSPAIKALSEIWDLKGAKELPRVVLKNADESLAPPHPDGKGGFIERDRLYYLVPLSEALGQTDTSEHREHADLDELDREVRGLRVIRRITKGALVMMTSKGLVTAAREITLALSRPQQSLEPDLTGDPIGRVNAGRVVDLGLDEVFQLLMSLRGLSSEEEGSEPQDPTFGVSLDKKSRIVLDWRERMAPVWRFVDPPSPEPTAEEDLAFFGLAEEDPVKGAQAGAFSAELQAANAPSDRVVKFELKEITTEAASGDDLDPGEDGL